MAIISQTMLEERLTSAVLIRLTDDAAAGVVGADAMNQAVAEGEGELNHLVGQRYTLPLDLGDADLAAIVRAMWTDAVVYRLYMRRGTPPEEVTKAYQHAVEWASKVATGATGLPGETALGESPAQGGRVIVTGSTKVITRESMSGL